MNRAGTAVPMPWCCTPQTCKCAGGSGSLPASAAATGQLDSSSASCAIIVLPLHHFVVLSPKIQPCFFIPSECYFFRERKARGKSYSLHESGLFWMWQDVLSFQHPRTVQSRLTHSGFAVKHQLLCWTRKHKGKRQKSFSLPCLLQSPCTRGCKSRHSLSSGLASPVEGQGWDMTCSSIPITTAYPAPSLKLNLFCLERSALSLTGTGAEQRGKALQGGRTLF